MKTATAATVVAALAASALADIRTGFEGPTYVGSAAGTVATGQDGWTLPAGIDANIFTYAGNAPGFAINPTGGDQFIGGRSNGGTDFARAQHTNDFTTDNRWLLAYDFAALWDGTPPSAANLSSFSLQDSVAARSFIALNNWTDNADPSLGWKAEYNVFDAAGAALVNQSPGAAWTNLTPNHWYRQATVIDFSTNAILEVRLTDLTTNTTSVATPSGWFLLGGATPTQPMPTAVRFFHGGNAGNNMGWDNLVVIPGPSSLALVGVGMLAMRRRRN